MKSEEEKLNERRWMANRQERLQLFPALNAKVHFQ